jgi:replicative DNA helicase
LFARADEGRRNETAYTVSRRLARRGIPLSDAREVMAAVWNGKACQPPLPTAELLKVVNNAYSKGVNEFVDEGNYAGKIISIKGGMESVAKQFQTQQSGFLTGYEMWDNYTMGFGPEELIWITGRSGSFKSAVLTNILQRGSKLAKKPALYFSMEMGPETLIPRTIQQAQGLTKREVVTSLRSGKPMSNYSKTMEDFEYVKFVYLSNLTTEQVLGLIDYHIETYGELSAIGFDYLGLFRGVNNNTERTAKQAQELKTVICKAARCPVFCLTQAKQVYEGREGDIELDRSCPKDSDSILDLGDYAMGFWGHWAQDQITGLETKYQFGRFFKARGMDDGLYGVDPYFGLNLDKQFMRLNDVVYIANPPQFKSKNGERE